MAIYCIIAWRVFWLTMIQRTDPNISAAVIFTDSEIDILHRLRESETWPDKPTAAVCIMIVAKLGGYLARGKDPQPGNMIVWRGMSRLTDIHLGFELGRGVVGN